MTKEQNNNNKASGEGYFSSAHLYFQITLARGYRGRTVQAPPVT